MLSGFAASRSRISWLSVNSMCSHLMSSLSYSAWRGEGPGEVTCMVYEVELKIPGTILPNNNMQYVCIFI